MGRHLSPAQVFGCLVIVTFVHSAGQLRLTIDPLTFFRSIQFIMFVSQSRALSLFISRVFLAFDGMREVQRLNKTIYSV